MTKRPAFAILLLASSACVSTPDTPAEYESAMSNESADEPAQLLVCPGYARPATDTGVLAIDVNVIVDESGTVRHTSFRPTRRGIPRDLGHRGEGHGSWQDHRSDARRLAQACEFAPAVHAGETVPVSTHVRFVFLGDPVLYNISLDVEGCPARADRNAKGTKSRPGRCGG